jgi:hypothetical protein
VDPCLSQKTEENKLDALGLHYVENIDEKVVEQGSIYFIHDFL